MFRLAEKDFGRFIVLCVQAICLALFSSASAQISDESEREVPILRKIDGRHFACYLEEEVAGEVRLNEIEKDVRYKDCPQVRGVLRVDFDRHSLITYRVRGDCFVRAKAKVFRNEKEKKYTVRINKIWGGCRAAGFYQGWLIIEKIPPSYAVEFIETSVDDSHKSNDEPILSLSPQTTQKIEESLPTPGSEILETKRYDMKGCIQAYGEHQFLIKDRETFLKAIRGDGSFDWCLENLEKIDFAKYTLLGIAFSSGYCHMPDGLSIETVKDAAKKQYLFTVSYLEPQGVCRHLGGYAVWVLSPKLPAGWEVRYEVKELTLGAPEK